MKSAFSILGLLLVLLAGAAAGYYLATNGMSDDKVEPTVSATPIADDLIIVDSPLPGASVSSPFKVTGKARGTWYFEASFPIALMDENGKLLAETPAQAKGEWMTTEFVPFEATLTFTTTSKRGTLIFKKDNPSGEARFDDSREMTVYFK